MQNYQNFWHDKLSHLDSRLLLDYDTFISVFSQQIYQHTSIVLTDMQKQIIKAYVDPENQNQVYKSGYLLFVREFWAVPSNRTKLFNMKINLNKVPGRVEGLGMVGKMDIRVEYPLQVEQSDGSVRKIKAFDEYLLQADTLSHISSSAPGFYPRSPSPLNPIGFVTIGSSPHSHIPIPHPLINPTHLKLIYLTRTHSPIAPSYSFTPPPITKTHYHIRDVSTSSRTRYLIDNENKYIVLKKDMVIGGVGLVDGLWEVVVDSVGKGDVVAAMTGLNAERKGGRLDEEQRPQKVAVDFDMADVSEAMIIDMYDRNLYYPENNKPVKSTTLMKEKQDLISPTLKFRIVNRRTLQQFHHEGKTQRILKIGRNPTICNIIIDHIAIRPLQFIFQQINQAWFLRIDGKLTKQPYPALYLTKNMQHSSNRLPIGRVYSEGYGVRGLVTVRLKVWEQENQYGDY